MSGVAEFLTVVERSEVGVKGGVFGAGEQPAWCFQSRYLRSVISFSSQMRPAAFGAHVPEAPSRAGVVGRNNNDTMDLVFIILPSINFIECSLCTCSRLQLWKVRNKASSPACDTGQQPCILIRETEQLSPGAGSNNKGFCLHWGKQCQGTRGNTHHA